jgi:hypothetical protein
MIVASTNIQGHIATADLNILMIRPSVGFSQAKPPLDSGIEPCCFHEITYFA